MSKLEEVLLQTMPEETKHWIEEADKLRRECDDLKREINTFRNGTDGGWQPISTLPDWSVNFASTVLWNPCDGVHILNFLTNGAELDEMRRGKIFTHWRLLRAPNPMPKPITNVVPIK